MIDTRKFISSFIGEYDELEKMISFMSQDSPSYPSHDIFKHETHDKEDEKFEIVIALPGFERKDVSIMTEGNKLKISGSIPVTQDRKEALYQSISRGSFTKIFTLSPNVYVSGAKLENGLLTISLIKKIPEEMKEKQISID